MTVHVYKLPQPYMELSLVAGGSLTVGQTYYFIQYFNNGSGYYGNAVGPASEQKSITPSAGYQSIKIDWWVYNQPITTFSNAGSGTVTVTSSGHGLTNGYNIHIGETANYNGDYVISNVTTNTFDISASWAGSETGILAWDKGLPNYSTKYQGAIWKWDKYSMLRSDGSYYQWFNLNDPSVSASVGGDEYYLSQSLGRYGHRKWTTKYYHQGYYSSNSITFTKEETSSGYNLLMDGNVVGTSVTGNMRHPQIAYNKIAYPTLYGDDKFNINKGRLLIFSDSNDATTDDLIDALKASGYDDMYFITNDYTFHSAMKGVVIGAHFQQPVNGGFKFTDLNLTLVGGNLSHLGDSGYQGFNFERSVLVTIGMQYSSWITERPASYKDSTRCHLGNAYILDYVQSDNSSFQGIMTFYSRQPKGFNMIGGYPGSSTSFQWRYQRKNYGDQSIMEDFYIKNYHIMFTQDSYGNITGIMKNIIFENINHSINYDIYVAWGYVDGNCNYVMECTGVISDRNDGQLKIYSDNNSSYTTNDVWYFRYDINVNIIDEVGNNIDDVYVKLDWGSGNTTSTTVSGQATVQGLGYTLTKNHNTGGNYYVNSDWNKMELTISKPGYITKKFKELLIKENKNWTIVLKRLQINIDQETIN